MRIFHADHKHTARSVFLGLLIFLIACAPTPLHSIPTSQPDPDTITGIVIDEDGQPIKGALVRVKTTQHYVITDSEGNFKLEGLEDGKQIKVTVWAPGYFIGGGDVIMPGTTNVVIVLHKHHDTDNPDYAWLSSIFHSGEGENQGCSECHSNVGAGLSFSLPVDEWLLDAHAQSAQNPRFLSMYSGTDLDGNQSPLTRYVNSKDYGLLPLLPDESQSYYGPGYKLDFPNSAGNCAACHTPLAAVGNAYGVDPTVLSDIEKEGVSCDFCHKVWDVELDTQTGMPNPNMPGVLSYSFLRPYEGHQFFAGPLDDVAPGEDTYSHLQQQSQFCAPCHFGVFWDTVVYNSFGEWMNSPYSNPEKGMTCQDCHMPPTGATLFALPEVGGEERDPKTIYSHYMPGAMDKTLLQNAVSVTVSVEQPANQIIVNVNIMNDNTGHHVPTDSPLRQLLLLVEAKGDNGELLELIEGSTIPEWGGVGDPKEGYYAGLPGKGYAKILEEIWTGISPSGAYWNPTRVLSDNRIAAYEEDSSSYVFAPLSEGAVNITIRLLFRRAFIDLMELKKWDTPDILMYQKNVTINIEP